MSKITPASPVAIAIEYERLNSLPNCPSCGQYSDADIMLIASLAEAVEYLSGRDIPGHSSTPIHSLVTLAEARVAKINEHRDDPVPRDPDSNRQPVSWYAVEHLSKLLQERTIKAREKMAREVFLNEKVALAE